MEISLSFITIPSYNISIQKYYIQFSAFAHKSQPYICAFCSIYAQMEHFYSISYRGLWAFSRPVGSGAAAKRP
jgi:hypothetical protein